MPNIISIDVGSGFTKATNSLSKEDAIFFASVVTPFPSEDVFGLDENSPYIKFDNKKFLTGELAKHFSKPSKRTDTTNENWHGEDGWFALFYQAIASFYDPEDINGTTLNVVTGIPQKLFSDKKAMLLRLLLKEGGHQFISNEKEYDFNINATVIPQAAGALIFNSYTDNSLIEEMIGVIDVGTYTTGLSVIDSGFPVSHKSTGENIGMSDVYTSLEKILIKKYAFTLDLTKYPKIVKDKTAFIQGKKTSIENEIKEAVSLCSDAILKKIESTWGNGKDMQIFITGGGASHFYEDIKNQIPHLKMSLSDDTFFDVCLGMYAYQESRMA